MIEGKSKTAPRLCSMAAMLLTASLPARSLPPENGSPENSNQDTPKVVEGEDAQPERLQRAQFKSPRQRPEHSGLLVSGTKPSETQQSFGQTPSKLQIISRPPNVSPTTWMVEELPENILAQQSWYKSHDIRGLPCPALITFDGSNYGHYISADQMTPFRGSASDLNAVAAFFAPYIEAKLTNQRSAGMLPMWLRRFLDSSIKSASENPGLTTVAGTGSLLTAALGVFALIRSRRSHRH